MSSDNVSEAQRQVEAKQKFLDEKEKDLSERQRQFELRMQEQQARFTGDQKKFDVQKKELEQKEKDIVSAFFIIIIYTSICCMWSKFGKLIALFYTIGSQRASYQCEDAGPREQ